ncbi:heme ABC exporter ATP-binding protein CcmA [Manganibacter manganicus]|uniref:Heme ABC exporter, ATP-binding protein CcmA n=1 Tax=Manganibacter manganicus TaxID=1873176 RepID=A0A1V8RVK8_9HYPH|nr:heme ABC exporter ATP-binding protein CcmA [Pseudaminobacter manganicus]OQM77185.1 heme ABC exporter, ATP-binding protein CcmA [Pseudaminobacter manganicus]
MRLIADELGGERGGESVFSGIGFTLGVGEPLTVTGPNGSGKSTLLRVVAGFLPVAEGRIALEGGGEDYPTVASACHYLGHSNAMKTALTVVENLAFWRDFLGETDRDLPVSEALEQVGLGGIGHLPFAYLSTGQRRRAAIAKLLVAHRPLWLLDEPTAGLDKASEARFAGLMQAHCAAGGMIVAATHLPLGLEGARELRMGFKERTVIAGGIC